MHSGGGCTTFKMQKLHSDGVSVIESRISTWCTPPNGALLPSLLVWMMFVVDGEYNLLPCTCALWRRVCYICSVQCMAMHRNGPQWSATHPKRFCNALQCTMMVYNYLQAFRNISTMHHNTLQCATMHHNMPQYSAMIPSASTTFPQCTIHVIICNVS